MVWVEVFGMRRHTRFVTMMAVSGVLGGLFVGCGGGGGKDVDVDDWVKANCDIAQDFTKANDKVSEGLDEVDFADRKAKDDVTEILKDFEKERKKLVDERKKTGTPDVDGGKEIVAAFEAQSKANDKAFATFLKELDKLDDGKNFEEDFVDLLFDVEPENNLRADLEDLAEDRDTDGAQDVLDGIDDDPECASVYFNDDTIEEPQPTPDRRATIIVRTPIAATPVARATARPNASQDEKWTIGFCNAVQAYGAGIEDAGNRFDIPSNSTGPAIKDLLVTFLADLQKRTATFKGEIDKLGNPSGADGAKIQAGFSKAVGDLVALFDASVRDARALNANDQAKLLEQLTALGTRLETAGSAIEDAFDKIDRDYNTTNIDKLVDSLPQCAGVR
jgi:hypothetical protein